MRHPGAGSVTNQESNVKKILLATTAGVLLTAVAMAQTTVTPAPAVQVQTPDTAVPPGSIRQNLKTDLEKAGFTDITMMPGSFLVQAKNKAGEPVVMMIKPGSVTEVVGMGTTMPTQPGVVTQAAPVAAMFTAVPTGERMGSITMGLKVYNAAKQDIGKIKDVSYKGTSITAYIVEVGGFLGLGDHYVAVSPSSIHITWDATDKIWHAAMNATADQLKAAPDFKYPSQI
jgi:hypothetical protein